MTCYTIVLIQQHNCPIQENKMNEGFTLEKLLMAKESLNNSDCVAQSFSYDLKQVADVFDVEEKVAITVFDRLGFKYNEESGLYDDVENCNCLVSEMLRITGLD